MMPTFYELGEKLLGQLIKALVKSKIVTIKGLVSQAEKDRKVSALYRVGKIFPEAVPDVIRALGNTREMTAADKIGSLCSFRNTEHAILAVHTILSMKDPDALKYAGLVAARNMEAAEIAINLLERIEGAKATEALGIAGANTPECARAAMEILFKRTDGQVRRQVEHIGGKNPSLWHDIISYFSSKADADSLDSIAQINNQRETGYFAGLSALLDIKEKFNQKAAGVPTDLPADISAETKTREILVRNGWAKPVLGEVIDDLIVMRIERMHVCAAPGIVLPPLGLWLARYGTQENVSSLSAVMERANRLVPIAVQPVADFYKTLDESQRNPLKDDEWSHLSPQL